MKRYVLTLLAMVLVLLGVIASLAPLLLVRSRLEAPIYTLCLCLWLVLVIVVVLPLGNMLLKNIWFFRGTGEPVPLEQLRERILAVNALPCPVAALAKRRKIVLTWRITDTQWCELLSRMERPQLYELHCRFDADTRTVILVDRIRRVDYVICPDRVKTGLARIPLPLLRARRKRLATLDQYSTLEAHDYDFLPWEIKSPTLGTILACGWNVRFSLF